MITPPLRRPSAGFTLIELLVVITIIAILAAILFPVFAQAKAQAKKISCVSKVKQIAYSSLLYASDWDDHAVPWAYGGNGPDDPYIGYAFAVNFDGLNWVEDYQGGLLNPYMKSVPLLGCPSANEYRLPGGYGNKVSYGYNDRFQSWQLVDPVNWTFTWSTASLSAIELPAETITFGDGATYSPFSEELTVGGSFSGYWDAHGRHHGRATVAWVDGHVKTERPKFPDKAIWFDMVPPELMVQMNLGVISKFPIDYSDEPFSEWLPGKRSLFYYELQKPEGL